MQLPSTISKRAIDRSFSLRRSTAYMIYRRSLRRNCIASYASYAIDRSIDRLFCLRRSAAYTIDRRPLPSYGFAPYASYTTDRSIDPSAFFVLLHIRSIDGLFDSVRFVRDRSIDRLIDRSILLSSSGYCVYGRSTVSPTMPHRSVRLARDRAPYASSTIEEAKAKLWPSYGLSYGLTLINI